MVEIEHLWVLYGDLAAVKDLSFTIPKGEVFGFIGPNGAGKTSTIKVLATILQPARGRARIAGVNVQAFPQQVRKKIGYVPDFFGVYDDLTVDEYLHFFAAAYRVDRAKRVGVVGDVLALTDLEGKRTSPVDALSRGMKQRLGLARVLLHDPEFLLLDEPASGLDPRARIEIRELLKELKRMGKTILISSHILSELAELSTRIGIIEAGSLIVEGSLDEIYGKLELTRAVHVRISNLDDDMFAKIEALPGVGTVDKDIDRISIHVREDDLAPEDLLERLGGLGARVNMFQPQAMDIETAFMKLTEGKTA